MYKNINNLGDVPWEIIFGISKYQKATDIINTQLVSRNFYTARGNNFWKNLLDLENNYQENDVMQQIISQLSLFKQLSGELMSAVSKYNSKFEESVDKIFDYVNKYRNLEDVGNSELEFAVTFLQKINYLLDIRNIEKDNYETNLKDFNKWLANNVPSIDKCGLIAGLLGIVGGICAMVIGAVSSGIGVLVMKNNNHIVNTNSTDPTLHKINGGFIWGLVTLMGGILSTVGGIGIICRTIYDKYKNKESEKVVVKTVLGNKVSSDLLTTLGTFKKITSGEYDIIEDNPETPLLNQNLDMSV
jgi:hypothetical protein